VEIEPYSESRGIKTRKGSGRVWDGEHWRIVKRQGDIAIMFVHKNITWRISKAATGKREV
jgi:hypothetical protein